MFRIRTHLPNTFPRACVLRVCVTCVCVWRVSGLFTGAFWRVWQCVLSGVFWRVYGAVNGPLSWCFRCGVLWLSASRGMLSLGIQSVSDWLSVEGYLKRRLLTCHFPRRIPIIARQCIALSCRFHTCTLGVLIHSELCPLTCMVSSGGGGAKTALY